MSYALAGVFLYVNGFNEGFHESEQIFDSHFLPNVYGFWGLGFFIFFS